jgi:tetratricopeptide (TPR) repeat protein
LSKGFYDQAAAEARKVVLAHQEDHTIVSRGFDLQARALILAGRPEQAIECSTLAAARYEKDNSPYSGTHPVPLSLFMRIQRAKIEALLHQRLGEYEQAAKTIERQITEEKRAMDYLKGNEQSRRGEEFLIEAILRSMEGDFYRYAGQYAEATARYESVLQFLSHYTTPSDDARDGNGPPRRPALPTDRYLRNRLPHLIEQCKSDEPAAQCMRNIDCAVEIGDWHRDIGRMYKSKPDHAVALRKYREALAYLQREGPPAGLSEAGTKQYSDLRDTTLPRLISDEEAATK